MSKPCNYNDTFCNCFSDTTQINPKKILFYVYVNYKKYGLHYMEEDDRYNFILSLYPVFKRVSKTFQHEKATLENYVYYLVRKQRQSWRKQNIHNVLTEAIITENCKLDFMEHVSSPEEEYFSQTPKVPVKISKFNDRLLILGLKASWYLTDTHIKSLAAVTHLEEEKIVEYVHQLNMAIEKKIHHATTCIQRRNRCFMLKIRYDIELTKLRSTTPLIYYTIEENLKKKQKLWRKKLKDDKPRLVSTPVQHISKVLNVPAKKLENDLRFIKKLYTQQNCE